MNYSAKPIKTKEMYQRDLNTSRMNLLLSGIFTVVNLVMLMLGVTTSFLFSASIPYYPSLFFAINCRIFNDSYYEALFDNGRYANTWKEEFPFMDQSIFYAVFAISIVFVIGLFVLWYFSKKHRVCSMITLSFYIVDTLFLIAFSFFVGASGVELILQLLFHAWIVYYAVLSVRAWKGIDTAPTAAEVAARAGYGTPRYGVNPYVAGSPYGRPYGAVDGSDDEDEEYEDEESDEEIDEDADEGDAEENPDQAPRESDGE